MATNDLTAGEIEARPATETNYQLSARIYESAGNTPDQFQSVVTQLDQDSKSGAATGVQIDYDPQGKVQGITINNENLYTAGDATVPGQLASNQIGAEIGNADMADALNDTLILTNMMSLSDADSSAAKAGVLDGFGANLAAKLNTSDLSDARQYLSLLEASSGSDSADLLSVMQKAKEQSQVGDRLSIETDSQTGAATAFKIDGQDLLQAVQPVTDATVAPGAVPPSADVPPVDLFDSTRNDIPVAQGPDLTPPADPPPAVDATTGPATGPVPPSDATTGPATGPIPPVDSTTPTGPIPPVESTSPGGAVPPVDSTAPTGQRLSADATAPTEQDRQVRLQYQKELTAVIDHQALSSPVRLGEGYYQVVSRMHRDWSDERIMKETHRIKDLNGDNDELRVGQRLPMLSDKEKAARLQRHMDAFDQATPAQRAHMIAHLAKETEKYAGEASAPERQTKERPIQTIQDPLPPKAAARPYRSKGDF